jgi:uroporphyrinogen-III synthase
VSPLAGRRIAVTRASRQAGELVELLRDLGAEVCQADLIAIGPPSDGGTAFAARMAALDDVDWLVVTSPNGAERVASHLDARSAAGLPLPRLAVVGTATAAALRRPVDVVPSRQIAEALAEVFPAGRGRVLLAQAEQVRPGLAEALAAKGWTVETVAAYRTTPAELSAAQAAELMSCDAVLFASGSAARSWRASLGSTSPPVVAIGPATAAAAEQVGLKVAAVAADHSVRGMAEALLTLFASGCPEPGGPSHH